VVITAATLNNGLPSYKVISKFPVNVAALSVEIVMVVLVPFELTETDSLLNDMG
jgi:hypothetical protein